MICIPEVNLPPGEPLPRGNRLAARPSASGAILAAGCSGAMLLAEAGLLDGWEAITHWAWCDAMRQRFSEVEVRPQRALVVTGGASGWSWPAAAPRSWTWRYT